MDGFSKLYDIVFSQAGAVGVVLLTVIGFLIYLLRECHKESRDDRKEVLGIVNTFQKTLDEVATTLKILMDRVPRGKDN